MRLFSKRGVVVTGILGVVGLSAAYGLVQVQHVPVPDPLLPSGVFPDALVTYGKFPWRAAAMTPHLRQGVAFNGGATSVKVQWGEKNAQGEWLKSSSTESVSFIVTCATFRKGGNEVYVAGIKNDGVDIIEKWVYPVRVGGYSLEGTSGPPQPIGTPMPSFAAQETLNGPQFVAPPSNEFHHPALRSVVYRGESVGHIRALEVDPEGRFLLALSYPSGDLYRFDLLTTPASTQILYTPSDIPALGDCTTLAVFHHVSWGRVYVLTDYDSFKSTLTVMLQDGDNDGVFDNWQIFTNDEWSIAGHDVDGVLTSYYNVGVTFDW